jgi:hypothetical protein
MEEEVSKKDWAEDLAVKNPKTNDICEQFPPWWIFVKYNFYMRDAQHAIALAIHWLEIY